MREGRAEVDPTGPFGCVACGHCAAVCPEQAIRVTGRGLTPEDRLPLPPASARATADSLEALLLARRSLRRYEDRPVDRALLDRLLAMAATAPMGFPPSAVGVVAVHGRDRVRALADDVRAGLRSWLFLGTPAGSIVLKLMMDRKSAHLMRTYVLPAARLILEAHETGRDALFYGAPCVLLFHYPTRDTIDPAIACSYASLAAESLGLGSCMIGMVAPALRGNRVRRAWGIPAGNVPSIALALGYPAIRFSGAIRRRFASVEIR